jgi:CspA family cold shock protein
MSEGKVKWYNETKGFGFIEIEGRKDVFVHRSGLDDSYKGLAEGQEVTFDIKQGSKGEEAYNVK